MKTQSDVEMRNFQIQIFSEERKSKISEGLKGNQNCLGNKCLEETKRKISIANKGNKSRSGQPHTKETKVKLSKAHIGKVHTEDHTNKMALTQASMSMEQCDTIRMAYANGDVTHSELAKRFNCSHSTIGNVINRIGRAYQCR